MILTTATASDTKIVPQSKAPSTESGNTRLNSQKTPVGKHPVGIDWLDFRGLLCPSKIVEFFDWVAEHCDDLIDWSVDRPAGRHVRFSHGFKSVRGAIFAFEPTEGASRVWVSLPGKALAGAGSTMAILFIAAQCASIGLRCTRLDLFLDDDTGRLIKLRGAIERSYARGQASGFRTLTKYSRRSQPSEPVRETLYLGSRESSSFVRIYDRDDGCQRWERQTGRDISDVILADLLECHEQSRRSGTCATYDIAIADKIRCHLTNGVDFVKRVDKNLSRASRAIFWQQFLTWLQSAQVKVTRQAAEPLLERTFSWLSHQVSKSFALVRRVLGLNYQNWVTGFLDEGEAKFKSIDFNKIDLYRVTSFSGSYAAIRS